MEKLRVPTFDRWMLHTCNIKNGKTAKARNYELALKDSVDMPKDAVADKPKDKGDKEKTSLKERLEDKKKESKEMEKKSPEKALEKGKKKDQSL